MLVGKKKKKCKCNEGNDITGMSHCPQMAAVVFSPSSLENK